MKKTKYYHLIWFIFLIIILAIGLWFFYIFAGFPDKQLFTVEIAAFLYFLWGIVYHFLEGDLHPKIVVEYLLIALLAVFLLRGAIYH